MDNMHMREELLKDFDFDNPLLLAAEKKLKDIVESLINAGADIKCSHYKNNYTVLHFASENGWSAIVQSLLNKDADIQAKTKSGYSPLLLAASNNHKDIVKLLINAGADITCSDSLYNYTVLHYAAEKGWLTIVRSLLNKHVDIHVNSNCGDSPLLLAASKSHKAIVKLLINAGADINYTDNSYNYSVLHYALKNEWLDVVKTLIRKGADCQIKTNRGDSPLLVAAEKRWKDIFDLLLNAGADIDCSASWDNYTLLHYASGNGWQDVVHSLLLKGVDIQVKTRHGDTSVLFAASNCHKDIVELLMNAGADINCSDSSGNYTVLHYASRYGWLPILESLLKKGANIEAKSHSGKTSLIVAFDFQKIEIAEHLIKVGADVNAEDNEGNSPLSDVITKSPDMKLVRLLLEHGAYFKPVDFQKIMEDSSLKEHILQDLELCSQAVINKFNHKDLPELYDQPLARNFLPRIEHMIIGNDSSVAHEVLQSVKHEMEGKGHCNVLKARPLVLKILAVNSFLNYCELL